MEWQIKIEKVSNGFILKWIEEIEDDVFKVVKELIVEEDEKKEMKMLLDRIAEYFGMHYDKFGKENLRVSFNKKGHKI